MVGRSRNIDPSGQYKETTGNVNEYVPLAKPLPSVSRRHLTLQDCRDTSGLGLGGVTDIPARRWLELSTKCCHLFIFITFTCIMSLEVPLSGSHINQCASS